MAKEEVRLRFGVLQPEDGDVPTAKELETRLEEQQTQLATPNSRPERVYTDIDGSYFFEFATEVESEYQTFGEQGIENHTMDEAYAARVLYFNGGGFVFESRNNIPDERIPAFLLSRPVDELDDEYHIFKDFEQEDIRQEYADATEVSRIKFGNLGNIDTKGSDISDLISGLGHEVGHLQLSRGRTTSRDLKRSKLVNEFFELSTIRQMTYYNSNEERFAITDSGRLVFKIPETDVEDEVSELKVKSEPFLEKLMNN